MSTSKRLVRHTSEQLRAKSRAGTTGTEWARVRSEEPDLSDPDAPDLSAVIREQTKRLRGRPKGSGRKSGVFIRLDRDILAALRASGRGWQSRVNALLRDALVTGHGPRRSRNGPGATPRPARS